MVSCRRIVLAEQGYDTGRLRDAWKDNGVNALHSGSEVSRSSCEALQEPLQTPQPDRDHVRIVAGLARRCYALRTMPKRYFYLPSPPLQPSTSGYEPRTRSELLPDPLTVFRLV